MKNAFVRFAKAVAVSLGMAALAPATFAASTWSVDGCSVSTLQSTGCGATGNKVYAYAYSVSNSNPSSSTFGSATLLQHGSGYGLGVQYSGETSSSPQHTMDNDTRTELILLRFDQSVILGTVTFGWTASDADFSLFSLKGNAPTQNSGSDKVVGKTVSGLASAWNLVGNYGDPAPDAAYGSSGTDIKVPVNAGNVSSSWWLISAYNSGYGGTSLDNVFDYLKVMTIASRDASPPPPGGKAPEPGSLALLGLAMAGLVAVRRRQQQQQ